ncbi:MAG: DUF1318 domain-containing protein [Gammaproteobacteria bacterium]
MNASRFLLGTLAALLVGCVTINIYFPEAAAEEAADRIIDEVRGTISEAEPQADAGRAGAPGLRLVSRVLDLVIPAAAAEPDFEASSPAARALEQSLKQRFPKIRPHLDAGAVGLTAAGLLEIRDLNAVPLKQRNALRQLVAQQNTDWEALYAEIARINGKPEWIDRIRQVFAQRWVAKAARGWFYRDAGGSWRQK